MVYQGNLQQDYDAVLEMQLNDQELYYEKLIARETVRLLEAGYTERCSGGTESLLQESFGDDVMTDDDLASIEKLKVEISIIEYEYVELLKDLCQQESITASIRQDNNHLLKIQKGLRTTIADRQARCMNTMFVYCTTYVTNFVVTLGHEKLEKKKWNKLQH